MFALPRKWQAGEQLRSGRVMLRAPQRSDFDQWAGLRAASRAFLEPWEPEWPDDDLQRGAWRARMGRYRREQRQGTGHPFFIFLHDRTLAGGISLGNIRHGVAQTGQIGYWMGEKHAGKGLMLDALTALVPFAFDKLGLHRIEAACIPDNTRSVRLLEKAGFEREGLLRSYLKIQGQWRDHYLYARIDGPKTEEGIVH